MIDWVPVAFLTFKVLIFGACMFFAIKWHYDQGNKVMDRRALIRRGSKFFAIFILALVCVCWPSRSAFPGSLVWICGSPDGKKWSVDMQS